MSSKLPTFDQLMNPLLRALRVLGGSGRIEEIYDKVVELEQFPNDVLSQLHGPEKSSPTEVAYRLAWARSFLKKFGLLENSKRGIWSLTAQAKGLEKVNPPEVVRAVRALSKRSGGETDEPLTPRGVPEELLHEEAQEEAWKSKLNSVLASLDP